MYGLLTATLSLKIPVSLTVTSPASTGSTTIEVINGSSTSLTLPTGFVITFGSLAAVVGAMSVVPGNGSATINVDTLLADIPAGSSTLSNARNPVTGRLLTEPLTLEQDVRLSAELREIGKPLDLPGIAPQAQLFYGRVPAIAAAPYALIHPGQTYECELNGALNDTPQPGYLYVQATSANRQRVTTRVLGYPVQGVWQTVAFNGA